MTMRYDIRHGRRSRSPVIGTAQLALMLALAYIGTVLTRPIPAAVTLTTITPRVPTVTGIDRPFHSTVSTIPLRPPLCAMSAY
jgi:hypothetical protein